jgi:hypothetical protein
MGIFDELAGYASNNYRGGLLPATMANISA